MSEELSTPVRVLVIDDSAEIRDAVGLALARDTDFELVAEATSGELGVAAAQTHQPDLVMLDIAMPDMDGLQALPLIRAAAPDAGVVVLSGFSEQDAAALVVERGADAFIRKGVSVHELLGQLREVMRARG